VFVLLKRAHALADRSLADFEGSLSKYSTKDDLKVLRIGYVICRRRREKTKCQLLETKIDQLSKEINDGQQSN